MTLLIYSKPVEIILTVSLTFYTTSHLFLMNINTIKLHLMTQIYIKLSVSL